MMSMLAVRPYHPEDEPAARQLLAAALAGGPTGQRTSAFFRWKHVDNPFGPSPGFVAELDGKIVGLRLMLRWEFAAGDQIIRAVRPVDTATDPDHQGKGIFRALTTRLLDTLTDDADIVFNTPNAKSLPGYLSMGWQRVGVVPIAVRPVRLVTFARRGWKAARRRMAGADTPMPSCSLPRAADLLTGSAELDPMLTMIAAAERTENRLHTRRTLAYLRWRYADAPGLDYRAVTLESGGETVGLALGRPRIRAGLREFTLSDMIVRPGDRQSARDLLSRVRRWCGSDHIATHAASGTELRAVAPLSGYVTLPGVGMTLVARPFRATVPDPLSPTSWRLSLGDLEVF